MSFDAGIAAAARRESLTVAGGLVLASAVAWLYLAAGAGLEMSHMATARPAPWSLSHAAVMWLMWAVMMAAMMLPSAAPAILLYSAIGRRMAAGGGDVPAAGAFVLGYLGTWSAFSAGAVLLQWLLESTGLLSGTMALTSTVLGGALLIAAGVYQLTPLKERCLVRCSTPLFFFARRWRPGRLGALEMGVRHGTYCLGCCWVMMLLLFYAGVMNMAWIIGLALYVLIEKLLPRRYGLARATGLILCLWGTVVIWTALGGAA